MPESQSETDRDKRQTEDDPVPFELHEARLCPSSIRHSSEKIAHSIDSQSPSHQVRLDGAQTGLATNSPASRGFPVGPGVAMFHRKYQTGEFMSSFRFANALFGSVVLVA